MDAGTASLAVAALALVGTVWRWYVGRAPAQAKEAVDWTSAYQNLTGALDWANGRADRAEKAAETCRTALAEVRKELSDHLAVCLGVKT